MRRVPVRAVALVSSILLSSSPVFASSCWYPNEIKAAQVRSFQALAMVGALQCRNSNQLSIDRYNQFVEKHRGYLDANAQVLKAHFAREDSSVPVQDAYDRYATELANIQSARNGSDADFCGRVDMLVRTAASSSQSDLLSLAVAVTDAPASGTCPPAHYASVEPLRAAPAVAIATAEAVEAPAVEAVARADPVKETPVEAAPVAVATPAANDQAALAAAIAALQAATTALQTVVSQGSAPVATAAAAPAARQAGPKLVATKVEDAPVVPPGEVTSE